MPHVVCIGTFPGSPHYHRMRPGAPLWAACEDVMLTERVPEDEDFKLEKRGLSRCPRCWKGEK